ncbi:HD-GYP domain-containing protein [Cohnella endophytica]|uniref:HD-GYP domain-containing protein n=1 Tax=Cohnella endophytica TaxID=2419778 RepID=A0A494XLI4_9BACL|nr:HD-GYP domain-containing protein [Cohnella endophytica]RKP51565.1 HD-GYP domain-containing protein [Cohnella endophytica]
MSNLRNNRFVYTALYCVFLIITIWIDGDLYRDKNLMGLYLLNIIFAGIVFWRNLFVQVLIAAILTSLYYYFAPFDSPHILVIIFQGLTYCLAIIGVSIAIKYYKREKENTLNLTLALAKSLDSRDPYTASHSENVAYYALCVAKAMRLSNKRCDDIHTGGLLHDIGKIGVGESILSKTSKLTDEEFERIRQHPIIGYEMVKHISQFRKNGILDMILYHHERYDGKGYPKGLKAEEIPLAARIMAVADSFDAMTSRRVYRPQTDINYAIAEIRKNKGAQFDPEIAEIFIEIVEKGENEVLSRCLDCVAE